MVPSACHFCNSSKTFGWNGIKLQPVETLGAKILIKVLLYIYLPIEIFRLSLAPAVLFQKTLLMGL